MTQKEYSISQYLMKFANWSLLSMINIGVIILTLEGIFQLRGETFITRGPLSFFHTLLYLCVLAVIYLFSVIGTIEFMEAN